MQTEVNELDANESEAIGLRPALNWTWLFSTPIGGLDRWLLIGGGLALFSIMAVAGWLKPNPAGFGTHQQLGLPPCTFKLFLDLPCPTCGMTTSWSFMMHGQPMQAIESNLGGVLLWCLALISGVWMFLSGCAGRWFVTMPSAFVWVLVVTPIGLITMLIWLMRIMESL